MPRPIARTSIWTALSGVLARCGRAVLDARQWTVTIAIASACIVVQWLRVHDTYFALDDFIFTRIAQTQKVSYSLLTRPIFEHFSPMLWAVNKVMVGPLGMNHSAALALGLAIAWWAVVAMHRLLLRLCNSPRWAAVLTALFGLSLVTTSILRWYTTSVHTNLCAAFTITCLLFFVRTLADGHRRDMVLSVVFHVGALLTHEKSLLIIGYLALLWFALYPPASWRAGVADLRRRWPLWTAHAVVTALAIANFYGKYYEKMPAPTLTQLVAYVARGFISSFTPAFFGVRFPQVGGFLGAGVQIAVVAGFAVAIVLTVRRARPAWRGWLFLFVTIAVNFAVVAQARMRRFGAGLHKVLQYHQEAAFLFPIGLALVTAVVVQASPRAPQASRRLRALRPPPRLRVALTLALCLLYAGVSIRSNDVVRHEFDFGNSSRPFLDTLTRDARALRRDGVQPSVLDSSMPSLWMPLVFNPYNRLQNIAPTMHIPLVVGMHRDGQPIYLFDHDGHLLEYDLTSTRSLPVDAGAIVFGSPGDGDGLCATTGHLGGYLRFDMPRLPTRAKDAGPLVLRLDMTLTAPISFDVYASAGDAKPVRVSEFGDPTKGSWLFDIRITPESGVTHLDIHILGAEGERTTCFHHVTVGTATT